MDFWENYNTDNEKRKDVDEESTLSWKVPASRRWCESGMIMRFGKITSELREPTLCMPPVIDRKAKKSSSSRRRSPVMGNHMNLLREYAVTGGNEFWPSSFYGRRFFYAGGGFDTRSPIAWNTKWNAKLLRIQVERSKSCTKKLKRMSIL